MIEISCVSVIIKDSFDRSHQMNSKCNNLSENDLFTAIDLYH